MGENYLTKIPHRFRIKTQQLGIKDSFFKLLKDIYRTSKVSIFNGERLNVCPKIGKMLKMSVLLFLVNIVLVILASAVGKTK